MLRMTRWVVLTMMLTATSGVFAKKTPKRRSEVVAYLTKLEQGLFGGRELKSAQRLLKRAKGYERSWLVVVMAQYHRAMEKDPVAGLKVLAPAVLGEKPGKAWLKWLKDAETQRKSRWVQAKADAFRKKADPPDEPSGLAIDFPPVSAFHIEEESAHVALEVARCLMDLGKIQQALKVIDAQGKRFQNDGLVLSYECLGDLYIKMRIFDKGVGAYKTGIKVLGTLKATEGFSDWQKVIRTRIERKLAEAKRLMEIDKYGPGWVLYRDAEVKRRKEKLYLDAIWLYNRIRKEFPKTVYSEAARAYTVKCLLQLATRKAPGKDERKSLDALEKKLQKEKSFYGLAKRCKVPQASLDEIKATVTRIEEKIKAYKAILYGEKALEQAKDIARAAVKENLWDLYRGEMLCDLGSFCLETEFDGKAAKKYFVDAEKWFQQVKTVDHTITTYQVPRQAQNVSAPPKTMKITDVWGNTRWSKSDIGDMINRRTSPWYVNYFIMVSTLKHAFILFTEGKGKEAVPMLSVVLKYDAAERGYNSKGWPNTFARLKADFLQGRLFATKEDIASFDKKTRLSLLIADFFYEIEQWQDAANRYRKIDARWGGQLNTTARAYLDLMLAYTASMTHNEKEAMKYFQKFETHRPYKKTPSWPRAMFALYARYQHEDSTRPQALKCLMSIYESRPNTPEGLRARYCYAEYLYLWDRLDEAEKIFKEYTVKSEGTWLARGAGKYLEKIRKKRSDAAK